MSELRERPRSARAPGPGPRPGEKAALFGRLRPGPGAPPERVADHQRARVCGAVVAIVAEGGYQALTVREIVRLAGVSTHTFYELFPDKDECFRETYSLVARRSARRVIAAQEGCSEWRERLHAGFLAFTEQLLSERNAARLGLIEAFAGGQGARERMLEAMALYERLLASSFAHAPDGVSVPPLLVKGMVAGIAGVARARVAAGCSEELQAIAEELLDWTLALRRPQAIELARLRPSTIGARCQEPPITKRAAPGVRDDRERLLAATVALAARGGYRSLTAPCVRAAAGISRKVFEQHFEDVEDCFAAAIAQLTERAMGGAVRAGARASDWPRGVHRTIRCLCLLLLADPVYAKLAFVEAFELGPKGVRSRDATRTLVADALRASAPPAQRPSALAAEASVGAISGLMHYGVASGRVRGLQQLTPVLSYFALAPAIGAEEAFAAIAAEVGGKDEGSRDDRPSV